MVLRLLVTLNLDKAIFSSELHLVSKAASAFRPKFEDGGANN